MTSDLDKLDFEIKDYLSEHPILSRLKLAECFLRGVCLDAYDRAKTILYSRRAIDLNFAIERIFR